MKRSKILILILLVCCHLRTIYAQNFDYTTLKKIHAQENLHSYFKFHSQTTEYLPFVIPFGVLVTGIILRDNTTTWKGIYLGASIAVSSIAVSLMKITARRDRPFNTYSDIKQLDSGGSYSFPSGHASAAFTLAASLSFAYPKWYVILPSTLWAVGVAYSRMNLGVHYPSDVYFGALLGVASAYATYKLNQWVQKKYSPTIFRAKL